MLQATTGGLDLLGSRWRASNNFWETCSTLPYLVFASYRSSSGVRREVLPSPHTASVVCKRARADVVNIGAQGRVEGRA